MSILRAFGRVFGGKNVRFFSVAQLQNSAPSPRDFNVFLIPQSEIYCAILSAEKTLKGAKLRAFLADGVLAHFALEGDFAVAFYDKDGFDVSGRVSPACAGAWWRNLRAARARAGVLAAQNGNQNGANSNLVGGANNAGAFKNYFVFAVRRDFFANLPNIDKIDISLPECVSFGVAADGAGLSFVDNRGANSNLTGANAAKAGLTGSANAANGDFFVAGESFLALYKGGAFYDVKHVFAASAEDYLQRALDFEFVQANFAAPFVAPAADGVGYELADGADLGANPAQTAAPQETFENAAHATWQTAAPNSNLTGFGGDFNGNFNQNPAQNFDENFGAKNGDFNLNFGADFNQNFSTNFNENQTPNLNDNFTQNHPQNPAPTQPKNPPQTEPASKPQTPPHNDLPPAPPAPKTLPIYSTFLDGFAHISPTPAAPFLVNFTPKEASRAAKLGFVAASLLAVFLVFGGTKFAEFKAAQTLTAQLQNQLTLQKSQSSNLTKLLADLRAQNEQLSAQISLWRDQNAATNATLGEVKRILNAKPLSLTLFELAATAQKSGAKIAKFEFDGNQTAVLINAQKQEMVAAFLTQLKTLRSSKIEQRDGNFYSEIILK